MLRGGKKSGKKSIILLLKVDDSLGSEWGIWRVDQKGKNGAEGGRC